MGRFLFLWEGAMVSTHSRPKAAEKARALFVNGIPVSTHSRPKAADVKTVIFFC